MTASRAGVALGLLLAMASSMARGEATGGDEARSYLDKATAAYGLGRYAAAAENFEKAYELKPDPALLYNAAQAHRMAGNKQRALELYESYLRMYGKKDKREEVERRIKELKQAIEHDKTVATSPPATSQSVPSASPPAVPPPLAAPAPAAPPPSSPPPAAAPAPAAPVTPIASQPAAATPPPAAPPPETGSAAVLVSQPAPVAAHDDSLVKKPLFWVLVGSGVVAAAAVVLLLTLGGSQDAMASLGRARGN